LVAVLFVLSCGSGDEAPAGSSSGTPPTGQTYSTEKQTGIATYYDADGSGNCSFPATPADLDVAAFNTEEYAGSATCGACVHVKGARGQVTVRIVDRCPECQKGHLDLSREAFAKIDEPQKGRVPIEYQIVPCSTEGNVSYHVKDGASKWWTALQVRNHKLPIATMEYERGGSFVAMKRESYNYFVEASGVGDQPGGLKVRITSVDGQSLVDTLPGTIQENVVLPGSVQFR
jgi:expansin (peptidoglycan-binding protein)